MKTVKIAGIFIAALMISLLLLLYLGVIWRSPAYYKVQKEINPVYPIMDMVAYDTLGQNHPQPYIYQLSNGSGSVFVAGIRHTKDPKDPQIDSIRAAWNNFHPTVALVEGRLGFLFSWIQNPVREHGEGGMTVQLAKKEGIPFYTWEPDRQTEIKMLLQRFKPRQLALFYSLRPYFGNMRFGKPADPQKLINEYISSRTDFDEIRGLIRDYHDIDSIWKADHISAKDWRETSDEFGWPEGYLSDIANASNMVRDMHMYHIIMELVGKGNRVFVTMGSSHAFRMEKALRASLE